MAGSRPRWASATRAYHRRMTGYDRTTALIVVDMQNDFADPAGSLSVAGADRVLPCVNREVRDAAAAGAVVVYTQDWHPPSTPHFVTDGGIWPVHCVADSWGAAIVPGLEIVSELRLHKGSNGEDGYSGFTMRDPRTGLETSTPLEGMLRDRSVERVVVCGLATDYCVKATALDAARLGFETIAVADAMAAVELEPGDGSAALAEMAAAGVVVADA
jgi:nicotinamidase/pyrazinamidase